MLKSWRNTNKETCQGKTCQVAKLLAFLTRILRQGNVCEVAVPNKTTNETLSFQKLERKIRRKYSWLSGIFHYFGELFEAL